MKAMAKYAEGAYRIAEQWPYLRYLGMGAWWAWIWLCYNGLGLFTFWPEGVRASSVGLMYLYSTTAIALVSVIAALLWKRTTPLLEIRLFVVGVSLIASVGVLLISYSSMLGGDAVFALGSVLTGMGTSVLCFKTGAVFGTLGRREVLTAGSVSLMFAAFLYFMGIGIPSTWQPAFIACMPLVSAALYIMPGDDPFPADENQIHEPKGKTGRKSFINLVLASAMVAATAGFGKGLSTASMTAAEFAQAGSIITLCIFLAAIIICFAVNSGDIVRAVRRVYAALILLGVVVILLSALGLNLVYLNIGKELLWMVFTCLMAYMVFRFDFSPVRAFGIGQAAYLVTSAMFWWIGMLAAPALASSSTHMLVMMCIVVLIVAVFAFVFNEADIKFIFTYKHTQQQTALSEDSRSSYTFAQAIQANRQGNEAKAGQESKGEAGAVAEVEEAATASESSEAGSEQAQVYRAPRELSLQERIAAIPERYGISVREEEIMEYFVQGRSANWIAEELTISKNTVRSHIRSIYTKLDVHTRQELLDFLKTVV